jgi:DNA-binding protein HU-beta
MEKRRKQMRKQDLIDAVSAKSNLPKRQVAMVVDATFNAIRDAMSEGQKVTMTGFGSFEVAQRNEREGRNPRTGEKIAIPAAKIVKFKVGATLKKAVGTEAETAA